MTHSPNSSLQRLLPYLRLPPEVTAFEIAHLRSLNRVALIFLWLQVPVLVLTAALAGTGALAALCTGTLCAAGATVFARTLRHPRQPAHLFGFTAMCQGALLVHFGQGPLQIEMHFFFYVTLPVLAVFANPAVILSAAATVALHHAVVWLLFPRSVFNYDASFVTVLVHALFLVVESIAACFVARAFFDNVIGLERIIAARGAALADSNQALRLVLDQVGQGLLTVSIGGDHNGRLGPVRSAACDRILGPLSTERPIWHQLAPLDGAAAAMLELGIQGLADGFLPADLLLDQLPRRMRGGERTLSLEYQPIHAAGHAQGAAGAGTISGLLMVISDITHLMERERGDAEQRDLLSAVERLLASREPFLEFLRETDTMVAALPEQHHVERLRSLHTIKGNAGLFGLINLSRLCHRIEDEASDNGEVTAEQITELRECVARLNMIIHPLRAGALHGTLQVNASEHAKVVQYLREGRRVPSVLPRLISWGLEPARPRLAHLGELARTLAERLGRAPLDIVIDDHDMYFVPGRLAPVWAALVHAVRNAVDHGLEPSEERVLAGKPERATLTLSTIPIHAGVVIEIRDDGRGVDFERVRHKARAAGLPAETREDLCQALFADGLSTRSETLTAESLSGRGVGMAAVRAACRQLGGDANVESEPGQGTVLRLRVPRQVATDELDCVAGARSQPQRTAGQATA